MFEYILIGAGSITTISGLSIVVYGTYWAITEMQWRRELSAEKRDGLMQSKLDGWNTGEPPEDEDMIARVPLWAGRPRIARRVGRNLYGNGWSCPIENCTGWLVLPKENDNG